MGWWVGGAMGCRPQRSSDMERQVRLQSLLLCGGLLCQLPPGDSERREGSPCLPADSAQRPDLFQTPQILTSVERKSLCGFAKDPTVTEAQLCQVVNRVLAVECVLFHSLILSAHKTNSSKLVKANYQIKTF